MSELPIDDHMPTWEIVTLLRKPPMSERDAVDAAVMTLAADRLEQQQVEIERLRQRLEEWKVAHERLRAALIKPCNFNVPCGNCEACERVKQALAGGE